ncbi:MAG: sulfotransferase family 2 domain-containing protein [Gammaproteobacteria bacterium]|nr:sulfotransferase family 2 domain-containing protein [Gammaproteobacteria bacterium]
MVSDRYRCIFIEVPKTGSTSIREIIGHPKKPHLNACQISREIPEEQFAAYFKFGFVRNPWDRAVSLYERKEGMQLSSKMSFDEFVRWMKFSSCTCLHPLPHRFQLDWFVDPHGEIIVDYIGRFERLAADWEVIARKLGVEPNLPRKNVNSSKTRHYTEYYTPATRRIIESRFAVDIDYFGYEFGG